MAVEAHILKSAVNRHGSLLQSSDSKLTKPPRKEENGFTPACSFDNALVPPHVLLFCFPQSYILDYFPLLEEGIHSKQWLTFRLRGQREFWK